MSKNMENGELWIAVSSAQDQKKKAIREFLECYGTDTDKLSDNLKDVLASYTEQLLETIIAEVQFDAIQKSNREKV